MVNPIESLKNLKSSLSQLPTKYRLWTSIGILTALLIALPVTMIGLMTGTFELRKRAATSEITPTPPSVSNIVLREKGTRNGYNYWLYENKRYPCGKSGNHEFLVLQKGESVDERNLLAGFHGGFAGFYKSDGSYVPDDSYTLFLYAEKEREVMFKSALSDGLVKLFRDRDEWRVLVPSYCSHDFFMGKGEYSKIDGFSRWGYLAAKEAIDFTQEQFPTDKMVTYGVSAGTSGAFYHGYQRDNVIGIVMDSNSMDLTAIIANCGEGISTCCKDADICKCSDLSRGCVEILAERIGFRIGEDEPHLLIKAGKVKKPIYFIWNKNDGFYKKENTKYFMVNLDQAIKEFNPGGKSVAKEVCVTCSGCEACTVHCPTAYMGEESNNVGNWITSLIPTPTPTPRIAYCNQTCFSAGYQCAPGLECIQISQVLGSDKCRNPNCPERADCICPETPTPPPTCTPEGKSMPVYPGYQCCSGLTPISTAKPDVNGKCPTSPPLGASICAKCGNKICGPGENKCNCPNDCLGPRPTPSPTIKPTPTPTAKPTPVPPRKCSGTCLPNFICRLLGGKCASGYTCPSSRGIFSNCCCLRPSK